MLPSLRDHYVFRDDRTAEIVISFPKDPDNPDGPRTDYRYRPQNQVDPHILVKISRDSDQRFRYAYTLANGPAARQSIDIWSIVSPGPASDIEVGHPKWGKVRAKGSKAKQAALIGVMDGGYIDWAADDGSAIAPGQSAEGFVIVSSYRPGFTTAYAQGGRPLGTKGDLPPSVVTQLSPLLKLDVNNRLTVTLGPRFKPDVANNVIVEDYLRIMKTLVKGNMLDEQSTFLRRMTDVLSRCIKAPAVCLDNQSARSISEGAETSFEKEIATAFISALL